MQTMEKLLCKNVSQVFLDTVPTLGAVCRGGGVWLSRHAAQREVRRQSTSPGLGVLRSVFVSNSIPLSLACRHHVGPFQFPLR